MRGLTDEPLFVEPGLAGARLASPMRRILAFAVDTLLLIVPTFVVAVGAAALTLEFTEPRAMHAVVALVKAPRGSEARTAAVRDLLPLLVRSEAAGVPAAAKAAVEEGDLDRAANMIKDYGLTFGLRLGEGEVVNTAPKLIVVQINDLIPSGVRALAVFGVPAFYFAAFTRSRRGATPGKRLLGIRVARLDGERLTWLESLERFVGYLHIPGTMFVSLADLWRDPNRRMPHDRVVHTAVFRVKRGETFPPGSLATRHSPLAAR